MKTEAFKAFIKPFEVPQRSVKIKIYFNFYFNTTSEMHRTGSDNLTEVAEIPLSGITNK